jgi:hypothetical protein
VNSCKSILSLLVFTMASSIGLGQVESGLSYMQAYWANCDAIHNYDVAYQNWEGYFVRDRKNIKKSKKLSGFDGAERTTIGRIVVDRKANWVFLVREIRNDLDDKPTVSLECVSWKNGIGVAISTYNPRVVTRPYTFENFSKAHSIPVIESSVVDLDLFAGRSTVESHEKSAKIYESSTATTRPDGSTIVNTKIREGAFRTQISFDPITSMPTRITGSQYEANTDNLIAIVQSGHPRFEKHKEIYRVVRLEYNCPAGTDVDCIGNCQFKWYQFNEDTIKFPSNGSNVFGLNEAAKFLSDAKREFSK